MYPRARGEIIIICFMLPSLTYSVPEGPFRFLPLDRIPSLIEDEKSISFQCTLEFCLWYRIDYLSIGAFLFIVVKLSLWTGYYNLLRRRAKSKSSLTEINISRIDTPLSYDTCGSEMAVKTSYFMILTYTFSKFFSINRLNINISWLWCSSTSWNLFYVLVNKHSRAEGKTGRRRNKILIIDQCKLPICHALDWLWWVTPGDCTGSIYVIRRLFYVAPLFR